MKLKNKKIFITGGAGFVGSHLTARIVDDNEVILFDNLHRNSLQYTSYREHKNLKLIEGDILNPEALEKGIAGADVVIHMAAIAGVGTVVNHPVTTLKTNLIGSYNLLEACKKNKVKKVIVFSTSEVYGPNAYQADEDGMTTLGPIGKPRWVYAMSKLASEFLADGYYREHGLTFTSVRPFNIYGPGQLGEAGIHNFVVKALRNEPLIVYRPGTQIRAWCYIDDMTDALEEILINDKSDGQIFNIGNPQGATTTLHLAETIIRIASSASKIEFGDLTHPEVNVRIPNIDKARRILGFEPAVSLEEGIVRTIQWYSTHLL